MLPVSVGRRRPLVSVLPIWPCGCGAGKAMLPVSVARVAGGAVVQPASARPQTAAYVKAETFIKIPSIDAHRTVPRAQ